MPQKPSKKVIDWEYCECGCQGFTCSVGKKNFWCFLDLRTPPTYYLNSVHGFYGKELGKFKSFQAVDQAIIDILKSDGIMDELSKSLND